MKYSLPLVSVIMPCFNSEKFIVESINSVISQTYKNWELIIIDDGSTDNSLHLAKEQAIYCTKIRVISQKNGRQGQARNNGIASSKGELIALLDSDDLWDPEFLCKQVNLLIENKADFINSSVRVIYTNQLPKHDPNYGVKQLGGELTSRLYTGEEMMGLLSESNKFVTMTALFSKQLYLKAGKFEERVQFQNCEDYDLWLRMAYAGGRFYINNEVLGSYRKHNNGSVFNFQQQLIPEFNVLMKNHNLGIITFNQLQKNLSWLNRVIFLSNYKESSHWPHQSIKNQNPTFLPHKKMNLLILSTFDIIKYKLKTTINVRSN